MQLTVHTLHPIVGIQATDTTIRGVVEAEAQLDHRQQASTEVMAPEEQTTTSRIQVSRRVTPAATTRIRMATQGLVVISRP